MIVTGRRAATSVAISGAALILALAPAIASLADSPAGPRIADGLTASRNADVGRNAFNPDDSLFLSTQEGSVLVRRPTTGELVRRLSAPAFNAAMAVFSPDGRLIAAANREGVAAQVRVWSAEAGEELRQWTGFQGPIGNVTFSPDGARLLVVDLGAGAARMLDVASGRELFSNTYDWPCSSSSPDFSADARWLCARVDGDAVVWDAVTGAERCRCRPLQPNFNGPAGGLGRPRMNRDGTVVAALGRDLNDELAINLYEGSTGRPLRSLRVVGYNVNHIAFSPNGRRIAAGATNETRTAPEGAVVLIWDVASGGLIETLASSGEAPRVDFSPDGARIRTPGWTRENGVVVHRVYCWDLETGQEVGDGKLDGVYSRTGKFLLLWDAGKLRLLDGKTGELIRKYD